MKVCDRPKVTRKVPSQRECLNQFLPRLHASCQCLLDDTIFNLEFILSNKTLMQHLLAFVKSLHIWDIHYNLYVIMELDCGNY